MRKKMSKSDIWMIVGSSCGFVVMIVMTFAVSRSFERLQIASAQKSPERLPASQTEPIEMSGQ